MFSQSVVLIKYFSNSVSQSETDNPVHAKGDCFTFSELFKYNS